MALSNRAYLRVPPDGAGKALMTDNLRHVEYTNAVVNPPFQVGDTILGASSSLTATVLHVVPATATSGAIGVQVEFADIAQDFIVGEDLQVDGDVRARVSEQEILFVSKSQVVGANNPQLGQSVDVVGAASVRFPEGTPNFDAAGRTEVSAENWVGIYQQTYDEMPRLIHTWTGSGGSIAYDANSATTRLIVPDTPGASTIRQTHLYHKYRAGVAQTASITVAAGTLRAGVTRRWGYFDERNGIFFEVDGEDLYVVVRSDATGSVVERRVPQGQWNGDRLTGDNGPNNPSGAELNVEEFWLYDFSFLYLGSGPVRIGAYVNGARTAVHTFHNGGADPLPFMATGTLPLRWEIVNTGAPGFGSEMRQGNATVQTQGDFAPQEENFGSLARAKTSVTENTALGVIRAKQTINGKDNRALAMPHSLELISSTEAVHVSVVRGATWDVTDWFTEGGSKVLEQGVHLTTPGDPESAIPPPMLTPGETVISKLVVPGEVGVIDLARAFSVRSDGEIRRQADITEAVQWAVVATSLSGVATDVALAFNWREIL